jgi:uncharacterized protein YfaP (DUF2135 family)
MMRNILITISSLILIGLVLAGCSQGGPRTSSPAVKNPAASTNPVSPSQTNAQVTLEDTTGVLQSDIPLKVASPVDSADLNADTITVQGQTTPGAVVQVNDMSGIADANGNFSIPISLEQGPNAIDVIATDDTGKQGEVLILVNVMTAESPSTGVPVPADVDQGALPLQIIQPTDGDTLTAGPIEVKGKTAPGATVIINDQTVTADASGNFNLTVFLTSGPNAVDVIAQDDNGDSNEVTVMVNGA